MIDDELIDDAAPGRNNRIVGAVFRLTSMHRQLIAAASIVLVVLAGISAALIFSNRQPIPVRQISVAATEAVTETMNVTENNAETIVLQPTEVKTESSTDNKGRKVIVTIIKSDTAPAVEVPTELLPTEEAQTDATGSPRTEASEKPTEAQPVQPAPTQAVPVPPSAPTAALAPTAAPQTELPGAPAPTEEQSVTITIRVAVEGVGAHELGMGDDTPTFCRVYDGDHHLIGDSDPFALSRIVDVESVNNDNGFWGSSYTYTFEYLPSEVSGSDGDFTYELYWWTWNSWTNEPDPLVFYSSTQGKIELN